MKCVWRRVSSVIDLPQTVTIDGDLGATSTMMTQKQPPMSSFAVFKLLLPLYLGVAVGPLNTSGAFNLISVFSDDFRVCLAWS